MGDGDEQRRDRFVRLPEVLQRTGLSTSTIYRHKARGAFPRKVHVSANVVAWRESDLAAWLADPISWEVR